MRTDAGYLIVSSRRCTYFGMHVSSLYRARIPPQGERFFMQNKPSDPDHLDRNGQPDTRQQGIITRVTYLFAAAAAAAGDESFAPSVCGGHFPSFILDMFPYSPNAFAARARQCECTTSWTLGYWIGSWAFDRPCVGDIDRCLDTIGKAACRIDTYCRAQKVCQLYHISLWTVRHVSKRMFQSIGIGMIKRCQVLHPAAFW